MTEETTLNALRLNVGFDPKSEVDALKTWQNDAAAVMAQFINLSAHPDEQEWGFIALEATRLLNMGSNVELRGRPLLACPSRM